MRQLWKAAVVLSLCCAVYASPAQAKFKTGPYIQNGGTGSVTICWESDRAQAATVAYTDGVKKYEIKEKGSGNFHEVVILGLLAGTDYSYSVREADGSSAEGKFRTFPSKQAPFRFAVLGDTRSQHDIHRKLVGMVMKYQPAFLLNSGDLVGDGLKQDDWDTFWDISGPLARNIFYYPCLGNHEKDSALYYKYFSLPKNGSGERYYSFSHANVFFAVMDSNLPYFLLSDQKKWLIGQLKKAQDKDFRIVMYHAPFYSSSKREPNRNFRAVYEPIFKKYGVAMAINGHDHYYERSVAANGVMHVISGGGGAPLYDFVRNVPESKVRVKNHQFMIIDVDGKTMNARAIDINGNIIDQFTLTAK